MNSQDPESIIQVSTIQTPEDWVYVVLEKPKDLQNLPKELIILVFECMALDDHNVADNVACMLVCKQWYVLITHTRPLWTTVNITLDCYSDFSLISSQVQTCIKWSQNAKLDVILQVDSLVDMDSDEEEEEGGNAPLAGEQMFKEYIDLMGIFSGEDGCHLGRWKSFYVWFASGIDDRTAFYLLRCLNFAVPNLEELGIHLGYSPTTEIRWETNQLLDILPDLTALKILSIDHRLVLGLHSFRPSLVVELTLIDTPALREFLAIGSQFTVIQRLIVDLRDRSVISGRGVTLPALTRLKASGWSTLELISHIVAENLVYLDMADADLTGSHLVGSSAYSSIVTLSWRSRDPTMMNARNCIYVTILAFLLTQCSVLAEIQIWKKHQEVFWNAVEKARKAGPALKLLSKLKIYSSGWEFNDGTLVDVVDLSVSGG